MPAVSDHVRHEGGRPGNVHRGAAHRGLHQRLAFRISEAAAAEARQEVGERHEFTGAGRVGVVLEPGHAADLQRPIAESPQALPVAHHLAPGDAASRRLVAHRVRLDGPEADQRSAPADDVSPEGLVLAGRRRGDGERGGRGGMAACREAQPVNCGALGWRHLLRRPRAGCQQGGERDERPSPSSPASCDPSHRLRPSRFPAALRANANNSRIPSTWRARAGARLPPRNNCRRCAFHPLASIHC